PNFIVQIGDPQSRDMSRIEYWGTGGAGQPIGGSENTKKNTHARGAASMAKSGSPQDADSQIFITLRATPELDRKHTVFARVISGMDVAMKLKKGDVLKKASLKE